MSRLKKFYFFLIIMFVLLGVVILSLEVYAYLKLSDMGINYAEQKYRLEKLGEKKDNLYLLDQRYEEIESDLARINTALPGQKEASKLLSDLDSLARNSGLKLTQLQSANYGKKQASKADLSLLQTTSTSFGYELPLEIRVEGSYTNFISFIKSLENYQRLISVDSVEIAKVEKDNSSSDSINTKLRIKAYLKK